MKVELSELSVHPDNERIYEPTDLNDLIESITDNDLLEPIVITKELGTLQIGPLQTGIRQIGLLQIGTLQIGPLQLGFLQITLRTLTRLLESLVQMRRVISPHVQWEDQGKGKDKVFQCFSL